MRVPVALRVRADVRYIAQVGLTFAVTQALCTGVVDELAKRDGPAELLAVASGVCGERVRAKVKDVASRNLKVLG